MKDLANTSTGVMSFRRATQQRPSLPKGCKVSAHNSQILISSGVASLDAVIGDGIPLGTLMLVGEDFPTRYSQVLAKYFTAQGVSNGDSIFLVDRRNEKITIPATVEEIERFESGMVDSNKPMDIAWRYENLPKVDTEISKADDVFCNSFDLSRLIDIENYHSLHSFGESSFHEGNDIDALSKKLFNFIQKFDAKLPEKKVSRVLIDSFCSPTWNFGNEQKLLQFLVDLKAALRSSLTCCMITMPFHLFPSSLVRSLSHISDICISLSSMKANALKEYQGAIDIVKLPALNSIVTHLPKSSNLGFKCKRKRFVIEEITLPPELGEQPSRATGCSTSGTKLDF